MRNLIGVAVFIVCACVCSNTTAIAQSASEAMDNLIALYMVRSSEPLCGFKMTDDQRNDVLKASRYLEEKLELSKEKIEGLYHKTVQSMEAQRATGLCDPNGEWAHAFKQTIENFAQSGPPQSTPRATSSGPDGPAKLTGLAAWKSVVGNTIVGMRDDQDFADYYSLDGRIVSLDGKEIEIGSWTTRDNRVCTNYPSEGEECYQIEVIGDTAKFVDEGGSEFRGSIVKGNPKNLK